MSDLRRCRFTVPGRPVAFARAGRNAQTGRTYTPERQAAYIAVVRQYAALAMRSRMPMEGPIGIALDAVFPFPKSWSQARIDLRPYHFCTSDPDLDNVAKLVADAVSGDSRTNRMPIVILDDNQVSKFMGGSKLYGLQPRLVVEFRQLPPDGAALFNDSEDAA